MRKSHIRIGIPVTMVMATVFAYLTHYEQLPGQILAPGPTASMTLTCYACNGGTCRGTNGYEDSCPPGTSTDPTCGGGCNGTPCDPMTAMGCNDGDECTADYCTLDGGVESCLAVPLPGCEAGGDFGGDASDTGDGGDVSAWGDISDSGSDTGGIGDSGDTGDTGAIGGDPSCQTQCASIFCPDGYRCDILPGGDACGCVEDGNNGGGDPQCGQCEALCTGDNACPVGNSCYTQVGEDVAECIPTGQVDEGWQFCCTPQSTGECTRNSDCDRRCDACEIIDGSCQQKCVGLECTDGRCTGGYSPCVPERCEQPAECGNGTVEGEEECDDGDTINTNGCTNECTLPACGDGIKQRGEECDDGEDNSDTEPDACRTDCRVARCGDNVLDSDELCDCGELEEPGYCATTNADTPYGDDTEVQCWGTSCNLAMYCGNGTRETLNDEGCDDGNRTDGDGCSSTCKTEVACGNGKVDAGEQCDNGSRCHFSGAGCNDCPAEQRGKGGCCGEEDWCRVASDPVFSDGSRTSFGEIYCGTDCQEYQLPYSMCGDGEVDYYEDDNGNLVEEECDPGFTCANGALCSGEGAACSDGSTCTQRCTAGNECTSSCTLPFCWNGIVECGEECEPSAMHGECVHDRSIQCTPTDWQKWSQKYDWGTYLPPDDECLETGSCIDGRCTNNQNTICAQDADCEVAHGCMWVSDDSGCTTSCERTVSAPECSVDNDCPGADECCRVIDGEPACQSCNLENPNLSSSSSVSFSSSSSSSVIVAMSSEGSSSSKADESSESNDSSSSKSSSKSSSESSSELSTSFPLSSAPNFSVPTSSAPTSIGNNQHLECRNKRCVAVEGPGANRCSADDDCILTAAPYCGDGVLQDGEECELGIGCFDSTQECVFRNCKCQPIITVPTPPNNSSGRSSSRRATDPGLPPIIIASASSSAATQASITLITASEPSADQPFVAAGTVCGNGILEPPEECDDNNRRENDGCNTQCLLEIGICGDGIVQKLLGEQCENSTHDPALPYRCVQCRFVSETCGDGTVDAGEECDDGDRNSTSPNANCRPNCRFGACGDGILDSSELCDDGNRLNGDGCDRRCNPDDETLVAADQPGQEISFPNTTTTTQLPNRYDFPFMPNNQPVPYRLPLAQLQPLIQSQGPAGETGPAAVAVIGAGAAAGWSFMRGRRRK